MLSSFPNHWPPHASIKLFNEYEDFGSKLDFLTQRTPFTGGSGTLIIAPELAAPVKLPDYGCGITAI
ncbi:MAG: hypothetical protein ACU833_11000 [Gammaproteobacteria bacterium]